MHGMHQLLATLTNATKNINALQTTKNIQTILKEHFKLYSAKHKRSYLRDAIQTQYFDAQIIWKNCWRQEMRPGQWQLEQ